MHDACKAVYHRLNDKYPIPSLLTEFVICDCAIERLFKLWKQEGLVDEWTGTKPWRVLCEVYAKLLAMVLQHWFVLLSCWDDPHRSLFAVAEVLRKQVPLLAHG